MKYWGYIVSVLIKGWGQLTEAWFIQLQHFGYSDGGELMRSLIPTLKYPSTHLPSIVISIISVPVIKIFGLDEIAMGTLCLVFLLELISGIWASRKRGEPFESWKFSRFSFKCFYYLAIIALTYRMAESYKARHKELGVVIFDFMHLFFVVQITLENIVSIAENYSVISGKPKQHWINKLVEKVNQFFS